MKKKFINKSNAALILAALIGSGAFAQTSAVPALQVPQYSDTQLMSQGCSPAIWSRLVYDYKSKRGQERELQNQIQVVDQAKTAPGARGTNTNASGGSALSCFDSAVNNINGAVKQANALMSIFNGGGIDFGSLGNAIKGQLTQAACNQVNTYVGNATSNVLTPVTNQIGTVNGAVGNSVSTPIGNVGVGGYIDKGATDAIPNLSTGGINQTTNQASGSFWSSVKEGASNLNPFK